MNKQRLQVLIDVLSLCLEGASKREIMAQSSLNDRELEELLEILEGNGFIKREYGQKQTGVRLSYTWSETNRCTTVVHRELIKKLCVKVISKFFLEWV